MRHRNQCKSVIRGQQQVAWMKRSVIREYVARMPRIPRKLHPGYLLRFQSRFH
jgi:hypothetical protein